ncbi:MAG: hypothetical protein FIA99_11050 [Ruminiclostridium sp.]|nr:hypothetical protein [Ruminiclostridium sp.]
MKRISKVYKWIMLAVLFQIFVFSYMEFVYLPGRGAVKATAFEFSDNIVKSGSMRLPADAEGALVSFDGTYAAYIQGGRLKTADIKRGNTLKTLDASGGDFSFYRWLPDRDMLIYSIKEPDGKKGQVRISTFDVGQKLERSYPKITGLPEGSVITDIELSSLTNVVYTMVKTGETRIKVYKYNIMDELSFIMNTDIKTIFKETVYSDNLLYQEDGGNITVRSGKTGRKSYLPVKGSLRLLAIDAEDNIYAGQVDDSGRLVAVYHGKDDTQSKEWKKTELGIPIAVTDVFITPDGSIYMVSGKDRFIRDVVDGSRFSYEGELLEILDDYIISKDDRRLRLTAIIKDDK